MNNDDNKLVILVVDDSDLIRHSLKSFFMDYNFEVITCLDGLEGIQKAVTHKPNLILLDLLMPNLDGVKMLHVIKLIDELKNIPVIIISGNTSKRNVLAAIEAGADRVISKPLQKELLIKTVNEILGGEYISKAKKNTLIKEAEDEDIKKQLQSFFISSFPIKKQAILDSIQSKNKDLLKTIIHEIKGSGGTIGFPKITELSVEIEKTLAKNPIDWSSVYLKCESIFAIVQQIEFDLSPKTQ
ncbi:MAG: response regulator [Ignavibacteriaceae bacterium]|nr:response regulator [Ignavibacteriaceae bacterium]HRI46058.1 response regulator [Ignavibacteriaceae bacterium]